MHQNKRVWIIGPLPPPVTGAAKNTARFAQDMKTAGLDTQVVNTNTDVSSSHNRTLKYHFQRFRIMISNCAILTLNTKNNDALYLVLDGGLGIWYNLVYIVLMRMRGVGSVWIHHRTMPNVKRKKLALSLINKSVGNNIGHIFLEENMVDLYCENYPKPTRFRVIRNAATCDVAPREFLPLEKRDSSLKIGFLSNLNSDKGFDIVANAMRRVAATQPTVTFEVAGAPSDARSRLLLKELSDDLGSQLKYHGHLQGEAKQAFFDSLDIFLFPTTYPYEAQPNVLYEAMAAGCTIISTKHACIPFMLGNAPKALIDVSSRDQMAIEIAEHMEDYVSRYSLSSSARAESRVIAVQSFLELQRDAKTAYTRFLNNDLKGVADERG